MNTLLRMKFTGALVLSAALGVVGGCSDDDDDNGNGRDAAVADAGPRDAGPRDAGRRDAAAGDAGPLTCGEDEAAVTCPNGNILSATLPACCVEGEGRCGLQLDDFSEITQGLLAGCIETNQPTTPPTKLVSESCTARWTTLSASLAGDAGVSDAGTGATAGDAGVAGGLTFTVVGRTVTFPGCCRLNAEGEGECGVLANEVLGAELNFGCVPLSQFKVLFENDQQFEEVRRSAVCDPETGEAPPN